MNIFNTIVSIFSLLLGFFGVLLSFLTFFAPDHVLRFAMQNHKNWREIPNIKNNTKLYRHQNLSGYSIEVDLTDSVSDSFNESWMKSLHRPDLTAASYYVTIYFNGMPLERELFLQYDGNRNFLPVPMVRVEGNKRYFYFSERQRQIANIVGYYYWEKTFDEVSKIITESRFNPEFLELPVFSSTTPIEDLGAKINDFRARCKLI